MAAGRKYAAAGVLCTGLSLLVHPQTGAWDAYVNQRFQYVVEYPAGLVRPQREAENGDGREFHARQGKAAIAAYGAYVSDIYSAADQAKTTQEECADAQSAYVLVKQTVQAVSCTTKKGDVLYYRAIEKQDRLAAVEAHYPVAEKSQWDAVVARMARSLRLADADD